VGVGCVSVFPVDGHRAETKSSGHERNSEDDAPGRQSRPDASQRQRRVRGATIQIDVVAGGVATAGTLSRRMESLNIKRPGHGPTSLNRRRPCRADNPSPICCFFRSGPIIRITFSSSGAGRAARERSGHGQGRETASRWIPHQNDVSGEMPMKTAAVVVACCQPLPRVRWRLRTTHLRRARDLYASAAYEEALSETDAKSRAAGRRTWARRASRTHTACSASWRLGPQQADAEGVCRGARAQGSNGSC